MGTSRQLEAGRDRRCVLLVALAGILASSPALEAGPGRTKAPKANSKWDKETKRYIKMVKPSTVASCRWMVETPTHVLHSTLSKEDSKNLSSRLTDAAVGLILLRGK